MKVVIVHLGSSGYELDRFEAVDDGKGSVSRALAAYVNSVVVTVGDTFRIIDNE